MATLYLTKDAQEAEDVASRTGAALCLSRFALSAALLPLRNGRDAVAPLRVMMIGVFIPDGSDVVMSAEARIQARKMLFRSMWRCVAANPRPGYVSMESALTENLSRPRCHRIAIILARCPIREAGRRRPKKWHDLPEFDKKLRRIQRHPPATASHDA